MFVGRENVLVPHRLLPNSRHTFSPVICSPMGTQVSVFRGKKIKRNNSKELKQDSLLSSPRQPNLLKFNRIFRQETQWEAQELLYSCPVGLEKWRVCPFPCEWIVISEWALLYPAVGNFFCFDLFCSFQVACKALDFCLVLVFLLFNWISLCF